MFKDKKVSAIILVAGDSTRYGMNRNKNFEIINDKPVFMYSVEMFDSNEYVDSIVVAAKESEFDIIKKYLDNYKISKHVDIVIGGKSRKDSVSNCINKCDSDFVIIHDGARPLIKKEYIDKCVESMELYKGVTVGVKSKDTIKITDKNNIVQETTRRDNTWLIQTPQCFDRNVLQEMHKKHTGDDVTDDCSLLEKDSYEIKIIPSDYTNVKITTSEDMDIIKRFIRL